MALLNYTTDIDAWKTLSEVQQLLAKAGASHFSIKNEGQNPVAASFTIDFNGTPMNFLLPCNIMGIRKHMTTDKATRERLVKAGKMKSIETHSLNVGWRIIKVWIESQVALIEVEMASIQEVFLPYLVLNGQGDTLAKKLLQPGGMKLLKFE